MTVPTVDVTSKKKPGRKPKTKIEAPDEDEVDGLETETDYVNGVTNTVDADVKIDEDAQYWLMKAEPDSRMEKGIDVKFSIDDLATRAEPEGWDGRSIRIIKD